MAEYQMIPIQKLTTLPRNQRLRKAASLVRNAELRLIVSNSLAPGEDEYLFRLIELLTKDEKLCPIAVGEMRDCQNVFKPGFESTANAGETGELRRALNRVYHLLLAETGRIQADWDFIEAGGALDAAKRRPFPGMQIYLEDIRSPFNVGAMFRAAESFGAEKLFLSPLCADPRHKRAERTAMGCVDVLPWQRLHQDPFTPGEQGAFSEPGGLLSEFTGPFFALETGGIPLEDFHFPARGILIAGSEELGVSPRALEAADASLGRVTIPTRGAKGSLNVSVAFGIVMHAWAVQLMR